MSDGPTAAAVIITAFIAVCFGSFVVMWRQLAGKSAPPIVPNLILLAPFWLPLVFIAYAAGNWAITVKLIVVFVISQAISVGSSVALLRIQPPARRPRPNSDNPISD